MKPHAGMDTDDYEDALEDEQRGKERVARSLAAVGAVATVAYIAVLVFMTLSHKPS